MLIGHERLIIRKIWLIHKGMEENNIPKDIRNTIYHKYVKECNETLCRRYYEQIT